MPLLVVFMGPPEGLVAVGWWSEFDTRIPFLRNARSECQIRSTNNPFFLVVLMILTFAKRAADWDANVRIGPLVHRRGEINQFSAAPEPSKARRGGLILIGGAGTSRQRGGFR
jgi:hypothetical protein